MERVESQELAKLIFVVGTSLSDRSVDDNRIDSMIIQFNGGGVSRCLQLRHFNTFATWWK